MTKENENDEPERKITRLADGWDVQLLQPVPNGRTSVKVKAMRIRDLRKAMEMEEEMDKEEASALDVVSRMLCEFTDMKPEEVEDLSMTDMAGVREVIQQQAKKLQAG